MRRLFAILAAAALLPACASFAQTAAKPDPWAGLRFLIGTWAANTIGGMAQAKGSGSYTFQLELRDHVLARHSVSGECKGPDDFDCRHGDLLYVYPAGDGQAWQAIYFDNEGHVIHYSVSVPKPGSAVFLSDPAQPGPQFRLSYELSESEMTGRFQMKAPGQADFASYLEWRGKHQ